MYAAVVFVSSPLGYAAMAINSQNNHKMAAFISESDITKPISDYEKMLKYWENYFSVDLEYIF